MRAKIVEIRLKCPDAQLISNLTARIQELLIRTPDILEWEVRSFSEELRK